MTKKQKPLRERLTALGLLTPETAAPVLGVGVRSAYRYLTEDVEAPAYVLRLVTMFERHGVPREFREWK